MKIRYAFEVLGHVDERNQLRYVVLGQYELGQGFSAAWGRVCSAHVILNFVKVAEIWVGEQDGANGVQIV